jgi:hypothetical protein
LRCADSRVKCRDVPPYRCATLSWLCLCPEFLEFIETGGAPSNMSEDQGGWSIPNAGCQVSESCTGQPMR